MRILAIGAHPDDIELCAGGTLALLARSGFHVFMCSITDGCRGVAGNAPKETASIRFREMQEAASVLGARVVGIPFAIDGELNGRNLNRKFLTEILNEIIPDVVMTHGPSDYHPDHRSCSDLVRSAIFRAFSSEGDDGSRNGSKLDRCPQIFLMDTIMGHHFLPHFFVDISSTFETKISALRCHRLQMNRDAKDPLNLPEIASVQSRLRGEQSNCKYAEGFMFYNDWAATKALQGLPIA